MRQEAGWRCWRGAALAGLAGAPYWGARAGQFVFDDSEAVVRNPDVAGAPPPPLRRLLAHDYWGGELAAAHSHKSYRPLAVLSYRLNFNFSQSTTDALHFKITNIICHVICCLLVWRCYKILLKKKLKNKSLDVPFLSALLFAVHPIHVEAVSGVVGRADILAGISYFLAFIFYHKASSKGTNGRKFNTLSCLLLTLIWATVSMLCKENGVTILIYTDMMTDRQELARSFPLATILFGLCLVYELTIIRKLDFITILQRINCFSKMHLLEKPPKLKPPGWQSNSIVRIFILISTVIILLSMRWIIMGGTKPNFQPTENPAAFSDNLMTRVLTYHYIYFLNLTLLIWPQWLCFDWSMGCIPLLESLFDARVICVCLLYVYVGVCLKSLCSNNMSSKNKRLLIVSYAMIAVPFLPATNIFFTVGFVIAERLLYIPSAGFCLLVTIGFERLCKLKQGTYSKLFRSLYVLLLITFALKSYNRAYDWQTEYDLFTSGLKVCPSNAKVHYNVAKAADSRQKTDYAVAEYKEAIRLYPKYHQAMNNLANLLKDQKKFADAEYYLRQALKYKIDFPAAWMNLAIVLANTHRHNESREAYLTALTYRSNYPDCYYNLGNLYLEMELIEQAAESWRKAIALNPRHRLAWSNLLAMLDNTDQTQTALDLIPTALSELPESPSIHFIVANILGKIGNFEHAEQHFIKTIQLSGTQPQAIHYANLGVLYHRWKKYIKAETMYRKALEINPDFKSANDNISAVRRLIMKQNDKIRNN